jgi:hypothetical protein
MCALKIDTASIQRAFTVPIEDTVKFAARTDLRRVSAAKVVRSERLPDSVEFEEFPETVNREAHSLRECWASIARAQVPLVDPAERTVIEEISTNLPPRAKNGPAAAEARP